jgi:DNA-binding transcriptional LysR family regulator
MELRHLKYFVAVAEEQNITRAAARLHVSQPPLSRQIHDLEHELGVTLFERGPKAVRLTKAGKLFLPEARAVLQRAEEALRSVKAVRVLELNVGYAPSPTLEVLPAALRLYRKVEPEVQVLLHDLSSGEMLAGLRDESLDVALVVIGHTRTTPDIRVEKLTEFPMGVLLPLDHPLSQAKAIKVGDLAKEDFVAYSEREYPDYHKFLNKLFQPTKRKPRIAVEVDGAASLTTAVSSGRGVAIVADTFNTLAAGCAAFVPLTPCPPPLQLQIAVRRQETNPLVLKFIVALHDAAKSLQ